MDTNYQDNSPQNIQALEQLMVWVHQALENKIYHNEAEHSMPDWFESTWANLVRQMNLKTEECLAIGLALIPELKPETLHILVEAQKNTDLNSKDFGGVNGSQYAGVLPTGQTLAFLLHKNISFGSIKAHQVLHPENRLTKLGVVTLKTPEKNDPFLSGVLQISEEYLHILTKDAPYVPKLSTSFPAELITTEMTWSDLVLPDKTLFQLEEIISWFKGKQNLLNNSEVKKLLRPGYRAIFHGPSGTGKTLSAQLLAKRMNLPLLKVHTPMLVSKWVGETEKNLNRLFDQASGRDWILLFDEGENLFGQRGGNSTQDQHSNQQIGFLLQKIEQHDGLIIISSNRYASMDPAFRRRFESIVRFKEPTYEERLKLWQNIFGKVEIDDREVKFEELAEHYPDMTGGYLINVLRSAWTWAYQSDRDWIKLVDILRGIQKETQKIRSGWTVKPPEENAGLTPYLDSDLWI